MAEFALARKTKPVTTLPMRIGKIIMIFKRSAD
jgi:hypothetical protein